jgi:hypothetical protein
MEVDPLEVIIWRPNSLEVIDYLYFFFVFPLFSDFQAIEPLGSYHMLCQFL